MKQSLGRRRWNLFAAAVVGTVLVLVLLPFAIARLALDWCEGGTPWAE